jgi:hypothetical protein
MNPPSVYDETTPINHSTRRITKIVQSIVHLPGDSFLNHSRFDAKAVCAGCSLLLFELNERQEEDYAIAMGCNRWAVGSIDQPPWKICRRSSWWRYEQPRMRVTASQQEAFAAAR